ncbi:MAG: adenosylcobinamide amidohydrolase, partial [Anaerolineae bacterium]|nr:adenosylcobinamide amidohydrolase [Thermoflexales bacterium]MDW8396752.1 adenosylcobinamide amidohydrolase [Anaerolineae bacterium]
HRHPHRLHVVSDQPLACLSSAPVGGGWTSARHILNMHVSLDYCCDSYAADIQRWAAEAGVTEPFIGLLTAAELEDAALCVEQTDQAVVAALVTLGISLPTAAGREVGVLAEIGQRPGTINTIVLVDAVLSPAAQVNAVITATEAKSLVLAEHDVRTRDGYLASGTPTDCVVIACTGRGTRFEFGGPISPVGALVGRVVRTATERALHAWHNRTASR